MIKIKVPESTIKLQDVTKQVFKSIILRPIIISLVEVLISVCYCNHVIDDDNTVFV